MKARIRQILDKAKRDASGTPAKRLTRCLVCVLPSRERNSINAELSGGTESFGSMAKRTGISKSALHRHSRTHLAPKIKRELVATGKATEAEVAQVDTAGGLRELTAKAQIALLINRVNRALSRRRKTRVSGCPRRPSRANCGNCSNC